MSTPPTATPNGNHLCPICGQPNDCVPARTGSFAEPCWCTEVTFDPQVLARIPEAERRKSCVCRRCAQSSPTKD